MDQQLVNPSFLDFQKFLVKKRKKNGDFLLPVSIETYVRCVEKYQTELETLKGHELVSFMNAQVLYYNSGVLHSAFINYLEFMKYPKDIVAFLDKAVKRAHALSSERFLQSKVLSTGELKRIMNEEDSVQYRAIMSTLYDTACRRHELLSMKWGDITWTKEDSPDYQAGLIASISIIGKGRKSRTVYLGKTTTELLLELKSIENYEKDSKLFVLRRQNGLPYENQDSKLYKLIVDVGKRSLERHIHPHCFRHTKLTHLADLGADILDISSYAGHSSVAVTQIYLHVSSFRGKRAFVKYSRDILS